MKLKRILVVAMAAMLSLSMYACGKEDTDEKGKEPSKRQEEEIEENVNLNLFFSVETDNNEAKQTAFLTAYDEDGEECWTYTVEDIYLTELDCCQDIGLTDSGYLFVANGEVYCINDKNADEAELLWKNSDFEGAGASFCFDEKGNLLICGYYGPDLMIIDKDGNTVKKFDHIDGLSEDTFWPYDMSCSDGTVTIMFDSDSSTLVYDYENDEIIDFMAEKLATEDELEIVDVLNDEGVYTDSVGNEYNYTYRIPGISGVNTDEVIAFNEKMDDIYNNIVLPEYQTMEAECSLSVIEIDYELSYNDGIYSIMVYLIYDYDYQEYMSFSFYGDGTEASNADILSSANMTAEEFEQQAKAIVEETCFGYDYDMDVDEEYLEMLKEMEQQTYDEITADIPMYLNEDGKLAFIATVYVPAGAGAYPQVFVIE